MSGSGPSGSDAAGSDASGALRIVLATANVDKAAEIVAVVTAADARPDEDSGGGRIVLLPRPPDVPEVEETGDTLEDNARLKADALLAATGLPAMADDTGLEVEALGGRPGVFSSRYSGEHASYAENVAKLLAELEAAGARDRSDRRARFRTVAVVRFAGGREVIASGEVWGSIAESPRGEMGFGYDPVFVPDGTGDRTFAEMSLEEKAACSHRGRAFRALVSELAQDHLSSP